MNMAAVLRAILETTGWSQERLADRLDTSQAQISRWLAGKQPRGRNWERIRALAVEHGVLYDHAAPAAGGFSEEPPTLRAAVLQYAIARVEQWLVDKGRALDPARKAEVITLIYEIAVAEEPRGADTSDRRIQQILQLVA